MGLDNMLINKIETLGFKLPTPSTPAANYLPYIVAGNLVFISGQLPTAHGVIKYKGRVVQESQLEQARKAAMLCALNILSQLNLVCSGNLSIVQCIKLCGFVNAGNDFLLHSKVIDAASELMCNVFGPNKGKHARIAIGCSSLPFNAMVEIDAIFALTREQKY